MLRDFASPLTPQEIGVNPQPRVPPVTEPIVNDFSIMVATKNGSGSQTANLALLRALFRMGIPVSGKNVFPSNIQGRPTWYFIRVSKDGYIARRDVNEIVVSLNPESSLEDHAAVAPGGVFIYADDIGLPIQRDDIHYYAIPVKELARAHESDPKLRTYVANMVRGRAVLLARDRRERDRSCAPAPLQRQAEAGRIQHARGARGNGVGL